MAYTFRWPPDVLWSLTLEDLIYWYETAIKMQPQEPEA